MQGTASGQESKSDISSISRLGTLVHIYSSHQLADLVGTIRQQQRDQMVQLIHDLRPHDETAKAFLARLDSRDDGVDKLAQLVNTAVQVKTRVEDAGRLTAIVCRNRNKRQGSGGSHPLVVQRTRTVPSMWNRTMYIRFQDCDSVMNHLSLNSPT